MTTRSLARMIQLCSLLAVATAIALGGGIARVAAAAQPADVQMCHVTGNGSFHMISVDGHADQAHRAHGDGRPGESVPGSTTLVFDAECQQVLRPVAPSLLACPCWNTYTQASLLSLLTSGQTTPFCAKSALHVALTPNNGATALFVTSGFCMLKANGQSVALSLTAANTNTCMAEATALVPSISWCPQ